MPILTERCALSGCHVADGPHGLDFRTYESFKAGGEHGPVFIPGNAEESEVVEQIVSGSMPPGGPPLSAAEIQHFVDWINQQEARIMSFNRNMTGMAMKMTWTTTMTMMRILMMSMMAWTTTMAMMMRMLMLMTIMTTMTTTKNNSNIIAISMCYRGWFYTSLYV